MATDSGGNVYIGGVTDGSLGGRFQDDLDAWVAKYSAAGSLRWKRQLGTAYYESASGVAIDDDGNIYIGGSTEGSLGGTIEGELDAWVAQYSAAGLTGFRPQSSQ